MYLSKTIRNITFLIIDREGFLACREWKSKVDQVEDVGADTIEFTAINKFIYNKTLSNGLTGDEIVTVINPLLVSMALAVNRDRAPMLPLVSEGHFNEKSKILSFVKLIPF